MTVSDTAQFMAEATSLHFDALQSWSGQMLVPAPHWQLALAHAGLLPDANLLCYPKDSLYTRITLQRLVPAPCAGFRLATLSDLPQLLELEAQWDSAFLRSSEATLRQRLELEPSGQFVAFGGDGALLAAMYTRSAWLPWRCCARRCGGRTQACTGWSRSCSAWCRFQARAAWAKCCAPSCCVRRSWRGRGASMTKLWMMMRRRLSRQSHPAVRSLLKT